VTPRKLFILRATNILRQALTLHSNCFVGPKFEGSLETYKHWRHYVVEFFGHIQVVNRDWCFRVALTCPYQTCEPQMPSRFRPDPPTSFFLLTQYGRKLVSDGFYLSLGLMSRSRLIPKSRGRNCELAFERTVESSFGLVAHFGCDLCHRIIR
jgi:hypothetical protein